MADILSLVVQFLTLIVVLVSTVFAQKGFSNMNRWFETITDTLKEVKAQQPSAEICEKCGKPVDEHTIKEAKKCGIISKK